MKKLLFILLLLSLVLTGCSKTEQQEEKVEPRQEIGLANPTVSYETLDEINEKTGCKLTTAGVAGTSDYEYHVIADSVAEMTFMVNGVKATYRCSKDTENDISGYYIEGIPAFEGNQEDIELNVSENGTKLARFFVNKAQYVFTLENSDMNMDTFMSVVEGLKSNID